MVGATAIDLTAFVRSRILNVFVRFVRFMVEHPVSGPHAIGPITLVVWDWSGGPHDDGFSHSHGAT
jgi:hypothetical protein